MMARHRQAKFDNDFMFGCVCVCVFNVHSRANSKTNKATKLNIYSGGESKREVRLNAREREKATTQSHHNNQYGI